jgi:hypothetical protein
MAAPPYLVADTRERLVHPFLEDELLSHTHVVRQINTGDYLICRAEAGGPRVLACIERKTLEDFAASFRDGRYENLEKLRVLRAATGCQLYFFIEGPAFPAAGRRFARIPYACILAAVTKLMVRDGVFVVQTSDPRHTAQRLADFLRAFEAGAPAPEPAPAPAPAPVSAPVSAPAPESAPAPVLAGAPEPACADGAPPPLEAELTVPDALLARLEPTDARAAVDMWARLRGVSVVLGRILTREFSVAELVSGVAPDRVRALRTATGRPINRDAASSLLAVRSGSREHAVKLVSGLRGVSPQVASLALTAAGGLAALCAQPVGALAAVETPQKNRTVRLGPARAERILRLLHYREPDAAARPE